MLSVLGLGSVGMGVGSKAPPAEAQAERQKIVINIGTTPVKTEAEIGRAVAHAMEAARKSL